MDIAFMHPSYPSAEGTGATHSATQIVTGLTEAGHSVDIYCTANPQSEDVQSNSALYHLDGESIHPHTSTKLNREVKARLDKFDKYDIVHSYLPSLIPSIAEIGQQLNVGTVVTLNAYGGTCAKNDLLYLNEEQCESKSTAKCMNCIARTGFSNNEHGYLYQTASQLLSLRSINKGERRLEHIDAFRAPSDHVKENYEQFGYQKKKIQVISHPLNDLFLVDHKSDFTDPIQILYVGALEKHKGVDKLVPIIHGLRQDGLDVELTVVGTGGFRAKMEQQRTELDCAESIDFAGFVSNEKLPEVYAGHDLFIHPGVWEEPLARVYIEALATGTPIVTREYGSVQSIIGDGGVTADDSVESYIEVISDVLRDNRLASLSKGAKDHVRRYERKKIVSQIEELYQSLLYVF
ncbi:probable glycosyltransferase, type 1 [Haloquadratum walsbyi C23]|uniref:Probable glycosyltransferase, type 1 n=2 Tax=Haloquadratum walsbyi TaxID=293091 RepID=G0LM69_HALWC|nr:probable glycosyltransferase, type 1 [Haloquadratum walsbyi C23]